MNRFSMEIYDENRESGYAAPSEASTHKILDFLEDARDIAKSLFLSQYRKKNTDAFLDMFHNN